MELPQSRPFATEGGKRTHDFLSLYSSPIEQDPRPSQGGYLKTHDFLQPLEQARKTVGKEENKVEVAIEKPPSAEHILPGGIGTYSISYLQQRVPKPEADTFAVTQASSTDRDDRNSNCSSYSGSGFTLWNESAIKKGKTGKENFTGDRHVVRAGVNIGAGELTTSLERQSQLSSNHNHNTATLSSLSSPQQPSAMENQSFMHMLTSAKNAQEEDYDEEEEFVVKKESPSPSRGNLSVKVDGRSSDQKPNTPRSKHSATEQRRRSKINDRFLKLREIIPHSDQKRDKASFLLEVIEYIQFLQEKVHKYEGSYQGMENKPSTLPWNKFHRLAQGFIDHSQGTNSASSPALIHAAKFDENKIGISATGPANVQKLEPIRTPNVKESSLLPELTNKAATHCMRPSTFPFCGNTSIASLQSILAPDAGMLELKSQSQFSLSRPNMTNYAVTNDKPKGQEVSIESGTISISSAYSQRLLNTLKQALQNSGVDLSQADMSVQIDLGKRASDRLNVSTSNFKGDNISTSNQPTPQFVDTSTREESVHAFKRLKTS
ncbi:transcription factor BIM1-like isoform X1 [Lycium ferocissimum]|uniref:transcription factor BIM1-like isoform X1 n=1 Tax=Lycium ferocissimum TaxID=112874 RepID=UPI002815CA43|nr:transcription factor BIM1-like isoform X1 [Lycium ferocissimum]XP_059299829.1 transcription factor BIM1-like isoform X1 [Lycium ferocissimum]